MREDRDRALRWLRSYHGSIDSTALIMAHEAGQRAERVRNARERDLEQMRATEREAADA